MHGDTCVVVVWGGDLGVVSANLVETGGISCAPKRLKDGSWQKVVTDRVLQGAGKQPLHTYMNRR